MNKIATSNAAKRLKAKPQHAKRQPQRRNKRCSLMERLAAKREREYEKKVLKILEYLIEHGQFPDEAYTERKIVFGHGIPPYAVGDIEDRLKPFIEMCDGDIKNAAEMLLTLEAL